VKRNYFRLLTSATIGVILLTLLGAYGIACSYVYMEPSLPSTDAMRSVEFQVPLRVYSRSGRLIAQIGEQRRIPVTYEQIPEVVKQAFLAAEDDRFFQHHGIDYPGVVRAIFVNLVSGGRTQGASTISMQAARNMFLSLDKTWRRKVQEMFLTSRMEHEFSKEQIFGLYLNVIFFGQRAYGVAAAAETFFGKSLDRLTVAEAAMLAGIPQAPSKYNPIVNPQFAKNRRTYVLRRMRELGFIDEQTASAANTEPVNARAFAPLTDVEAQYVAEMARLEIRRRFGAQAESAGYKVYTTIDARLQNAANRALRIGLIEYDRRHGWRGPTSHVEIPSGAQSAQLDGVLDEYSYVGMLTPAVVVSTTEKAARVFIKNLGFAQIDWNGLSWARKAGPGESLGPAPKSTSEVISRGDVVYVVTDGKGNAQLSQLPEAQAALVALNPRDGSVAALVGGFDYFANKYNRVTQARRQPGSGFKPFLYSGALENGFTPASVLLDAPIVLEGDGMETSWRPENSSGQFHGPTRLREALVRSRNLVSIRLLRQMGTQYSIDYVSKFGFNKQSLPDNLTLALGTLQATPLEVAAGYCVFANGGFRITPYFIDRIEGPEGTPIWESTPAIACPECEQPAQQQQPASETGTPDMVLTSMSSGGFPNTIEALDAMRGGPSILPPDRLAPRVISAQNAYLMTDMMSDVITRGTGRRALALGRNDLAGKTGTTNDAKDTWFNGFTPTLVASVWVGFDQGRSLGESEEGGKTALPIWVHFMREAMKSVPQKRKAIPDGLITLRISPETGQLASAENPDAIVETFMTDRLPSEGTLAVDGATTNGPDEAATSEPLF
jgi:penicillin-binding protein 1A